MTSPASMERPFFSYACAAELRAMQQAPHAASTRGLSPSGYWAAFCPMSFSCPYCSAQDRKLLWTQTARPPAPSSEITSMAEGYVLLLEAGQAGVSRYILMSCSLPSYRGPLEAGGQAIF